MMRGSPRPDIRVGALVIDEDLRAGVVTDDDVRCPIRKVMLWGSITDIWASDLEPVGVREFEKALILGGK